MVVSGVAITAGLLVLAFAPDRFVAGAAGLADRWGLSRVVIGAVVIGFGTSLPELLVSGVAAAGGDPQVGMGNIVGSNMANLGLIVAVAGLVGRVAVPTGLLRREVPLMVAATVAFAVVVQDGLRPWEGGLLLAGLVAALTMIVRSAGPATDPGGQPVAADQPGGDAELAGEVAEILPAGADRATGPLVIATLAGLLGTLAGAQLLVSGAVDVADELGVSGGFVGMTVVALGTSLPELVTAVAAARTGEDQLILGNVLGSNLFNCLAVGAVVAFAGAEPATGTGVPGSAVALMLVLTALGTSAMVRRRLVTRGESVALLATYVAFLPLLAT
jgi:cation:H+ antiporter